ncbi:MAG: hypothetical protein ACKOWK_01195 [Micrococcales bacterium]
MFTPIAWNNLIYVGFAALVATALVVILFSLGIRLSVNADHHKAQAVAGNVKALRAEAFNRAVAYSLFALSFGAVVFGVLLIIPGVIPGIK